MGARVSRQYARRRKGMTAGRAYVGAVSGMGAHMFLQVAGVRGGFAAERALKNELSHRPIPPLLARTIAPSTCSTDTLIFSAPLASVRCRISHLTYACRLALLVKSDFACPSNKKLFRIRGGFKESAAELNHQMEQLLRARSGFQLAKLCVPSPRFLL